MPCNEARKDEERGSVRKERFDKTRKKKKILEILLRHAVPPTLIDNVHTREHDLDGDDDGDEHAHFGRRGGDELSQSIRQMIRNRPLNIIDRHLQIIHMLAIIPTLDIALHLLHHLLNPLDLPLEVLQQVLLDTARPA